MAGALAELRAHVFPRDYRELDLKQMDIYVVQSGPVLLKGMSAEVSQKALEYLQDLGVEVLLESRVKSYDGYTATLSSGRQLVTRTLIWAAGVTGAPIKGLAPEALLKSNRYQVNEVNRVVGYDTVFAIGDIAQMASEKYPDGHPQVAQPAIQQGKLLAENIMRAVNGLPMQPFEYYDKGTMATVGRHRALADIKLFGKQYHLTGWIGWLAWSLVHVLALVSFRNRFAVFITWAWNYATQDKGMRYIIGKVKAPLEEQVVKKAIV
jgi:NADH dehydrogenase